MKEFIMLVGECVWAVFTSEFDTSVTPVATPEPVVVEWNLEISAVTAVYMLAAMIALIIGGLVNL
jgi:ABC-type spermidine/putrescine transport system permease subunit II